MAKDKVNMPMSTAGITRYFDDYHSKIEFQPGHILIFAGIVILIVIALRLWGGALLG